MTNLLNSDYDIVFLVDDSGSMYGNRWGEAGRALAGVARIAAQYDNNGIDVYFLNSPEKASGLTVSYARLFHTHSDTKCFPLPPVRDRGHETFRDHTTIWTDANG